MNNTPIIKLSLAALSLLVSNYKGLLKISILPIALMLPLVLNIGMIVEIIRANTILTTNLPIEILLYSLLFIYGYATLNINIFRFFVMGENTIFKIFPPFKISLKFILLSMLINLFNFAPTILGIPLLEPIIFVLLAHLMLNLVAIANGANSINWRIPLFDRLNIAILQFIIPGLILALVSFIGGFMVIIVKIFFIYWTAINLALIFKTFIKPV